VKTLILLGLAAAIGCAGVGTTPVSETTPTASTLQSVPPDNEDYNVKLNELILRRDRVCASIANPDPVRCTRLDLEIGIRCGGRPTHVTNLNGNSEEYVDCLNLATDSPFDEQYLADHLPACFNNWISRIHDCAPLFKAAGFFCGRRTSLPEAEVPAFCTPLAAHLAPNN
jgi:hypothetical protein